MRALVTGANGLVGANLVRELLRGGHAVRALVRERSDRRSLLGLDVETCVGDILQAESIAGAARGCDVLFHAAAVFSYWRHPAEELKRIALQGTLNAVEAAHRAGVGRVVLTSTSVVCGSGTRRYVRDESDPETETDAYALAKAAQEYGGFRRAAELGVDLVAVGPSMCLGPHDYRLGPSNAVICSYLRDPFKLTWPGGCNLVSVRDVARGHILAAERGERGKRYILAAENLEWPAVHRLIAELCDAPPPKAMANHTSSYLAATAQELIGLATRQEPLSTRAQAKMVGRYYWYSHARAAGLGYSPRPARAALADAIAWLLSSPHISMPLRSTLRPAPEVYAAWEEHLAGEEQLPGLRRTA
jgi:dihydroflavonol-4-reductase